MRIEIILGSLLVCALTLNACGGDGGSSSPSPTVRSDEGIWTTQAHLNAEGDGMMHAVILNDGSFWGISGRRGVSGWESSSSIFFCPQSVLYGKANISGNTATGTYSEAFGTYAETAILKTGTYAGTATAKDKINLTFETSGVFGVPEKRHFFSSYDSAYDRAASLSTIEGSYSPAIFDCGGAGFGNPGVPIDPEKPPLPPVLLNPVITGTSLHLVDTNLGMVMSGTVVPHGSAVGVFDVKLTTALPVWSLSYFNSGGVAGLTGDALPAEAVLKGVLFTTSTGPLKDQLQLIISSGATVFSYIGSKKLQ